MRVGAGRFVGGFVLVAALGVPAMAQTGRLRVQVVDAESREPLAGATVVLGNDQGFLAPAAEQTDSTGFAAFPVLRSGSGYVIEASMLGFGTQRRSALRVETDQTLDVLVLLSPELTERIRVIDQGSVIDVDSTGSQSRFSDEFLESLPVPGRFYQNALTFAPGVNDADGDGNPTVHGSRSRDFRAEVAGVSNVDPLTGQFLGFVNSESIEVIDVITSGAGVEFGRAQGGFARIVQKQGTNRFEGVAGFIYRTSKLDGDGAADGIPEELVPEFEWVQPSLQLSGPIVKDKLWYRLSHEYVNREDPVDALGQILPTTTEQRIFADQLTWQASPRNKLAFQWQYDPLTVDGLGITSTVPLESTRTLERGGPTWSLTWTAPASPRLLGEAVVAWQDHFQNVIPSTEDERQDCVRFSIFRGWGGLNDSFCHRSIYGYSSGSYPEGSRDKRQRLTVNTRGTWYAGRFAGATHRLKFGFIAENERYYRELERGPEIVNVEPFIVESAPDAFCHGCPIPKALVTVRVPVPGTTEGSTTGNSWAVYVEDQIKPLDNLTVTVGLRVDREEINAKGKQPFDPEAELAQFNELLDLGHPITNALRMAFTAYPDVLGFQQQLADVLGQDVEDVPLGPGAIQSTLWFQKQRLDDIHLDNTNFAPRLAVAWDPWGHGRSKFSVSAGRYYDKIFLAVPLVELEPLSTNIVFDANSQFIGNQGSAGGHVFGNSVSANDLLSAINPTISAHFVDRNLSTPYQDEWVVGWEQALWPETSLRFSWVQRKFRDQLQDVDINHATGDKGRCIPSAVFGNPVVIPSNGEGSRLTDLYTFESYIDTDPGSGDGRIDDCTGAVETVTTNRFGTAFSRKPVPDGLPDLYVQNPGWGELLVLGNNNEANYQALVLELVRRLYRNWELQGSYTWSEAEGDAEDFDQQQGNERNLVDQEFGWLSHDQRHVAQVTAMTITPWWGLRLGGHVRWESGTPYSILVPKLTVFSGPPEMQNLARDRDVQFRLRYPTGQRNDQRNPSFWTFDMRLAKEFHVARRANMQFTFEVFNLFNDGTIQIDDEVGHVISGTRRFGRRYQLGLRLAF